MADVIDIAQEIEELALATAIRSRKAAPGLKLQPAGICQNENCGEDVTGDRLFCNRACADEYEETKR
ncbi:hypothetical protein [Terasakiella sp.]|uniref:hypothetical protein n=1 Tax=Terasakiella sp. TaxID=2034861 RepID=UPI003AA98A28